MALSSANLAQLLNIHTDIQMYLPTNEGGRWNFANRAVQMGRTAESNNEVCMPLDTAVHHAIRCRRMPNAHASTRNIDCTTITSPTDTEDLTKKTVRTIHRKQN
jgi:hypothetical protein